MVNYTKKTTFLNRKKIGETGLRIRDYPRPPSSTNLFPKSEHLAVLLLARFWQGRSEQGSGERIHDRRYIWQTNILISAYSLRASLSVSGGILITI